MLGASVWNDVASESEAVKEDERQTARDVRAAFIFGIVAASIELGVLLYFFR